jgi:hypothetical protein
MDVLIKLLSSSGNVWIALIGLFLIVIYQITKYMYDKSKNDKKIDESFKNVNIALLEIRNIINSTIKDNINLIQTTVAALSQDYQDSDDDIHKILDKLFLNVESINKQLDVVKNHYSDKIRDIDIYHARHEDRLKNQCDAINSMSKDVLELKNKIEYLRIEITSSDGNKNKRKINQGL